jgi:hypothetical protein
VQAVGEAAHAQTNLSATPSEAAADAYKLKTVASLGAVQTTLEKGLISRVRISGALALLWILASVLLVDSYIEVDVDVC